MLRFLNMLWPEELRAFIDSHQIRFEQFEMGFTISWARPW